MKPIVKKTLIATAVLSGLFVILVILDELDKNSQRRAMSYNELPPIKVKTHRVEYGPVSDWVLGEGIAEAVNKRHLQFESLGRVTYVAQTQDGQSIKEGSTVKGPQEGEAFGQLLARLDPRDSMSNIRQSEAVFRAVRLGIEMRQSALAQTKNELEQARIDRDRKRVLFDKQLLSKSDLELANNRYENAVEAVESSEAELAAAKSKSQGALAQLNQASRGQEKAAIFAPFDGLVARINIKEGDYFDPANVNHSNKGVLLSTAPITIIDPREMEVTLNILSLIGTRVKVDQPAFIATGGVDWFRHNTNDNDYVFEGKVHSVSPQLDRSGRSIRVKVRMHQDKNLLLDGMYVTCWIQVEQKPDALRIPLNSLLYQNDSPYVYVARYGQAEQRKIVVGIEDDEYVEVLEGLEPNEEVVTRGRHILSNGHPIQVLDDDNDQ